MRAIIIKLAGCVITDYQGKILLIHRNELHRQQWEIPGGKVEPGETPKLTAEREIQEELGLNVAVGRRLGGQEFVERGTTYYYTWHAAKIISGTPSIKEPELFDDVKYLSLDDLHKIHDILSINVQNFLAMLKQEGIELGR